MTAMADVIPFPGPLPPPDWAAIDAVAAELGLWFEPPRLRLAGRTPIPAPPNRR